MRTPEAPQALHRKESMQQAQAGDAIPSATFTVKVSRQTGSEGGKIAFGPFRPLDKTPAGSLTQQQQEHLDRLISEYTAKYPKTRQFTADHRKVFADPRAAGGFNPLWKEMVFPAVTDRSGGCISMISTGTSGSMWSMDSVPDFLATSQPLWWRPSKPQLDRGYEIGPTCPIAGEVARMVCEFSGKDRVAFCNTGSEALMAAIRVSRTITGRDRIAMFAGSCSWDLR